MATGQIRKLIVTVPPQHGKSEFISRYFPAWHLGTFPSKRLALISYGSDYAETWGGRARDNLEAWGEDVFGLTVSKSQRARGDWELANNRGGLFATGIDGSITGRPVDGLIIDDPIKNAVEAFSSATRERHKDFWLSVSKTRLAADAWWIILQTRWHEDDLAGWLIRREKDVVVLNLAALAFDPLALPERERALYQGDPLGREPGEPLCPQLKPLSFLEDARQDNDYFFSAMYQGRPVPVGGGMFSESWFKFWDLATLPIERHPDGHYWYPRAGEKFDEVVSSWDFPKKLTERGSYMVGQVWARKGVERYLLDQVRKRVDVEQMPEEVKALLKKWPMIQGHFIEDKAAGPDVMRELRREGVTNIIPIVPEGSKDLRASACTFIARSGNVWIPSFHLYDWVRDWLAEITSFPNYPFNDQMDAMTQALNNMIVAAAVSKIYSAPTRAKWSALVRR